jgi:N-acetylglutamate synthase-like GNAT family acetyltransferase
VFTFMELYIKDKIIDFIQENLKYHNRKLLEEYIDEHEKYGTILFALNELGEVIAVCRWNMKENNTVGEILDLAIRDDWKRKGIAKDFINNALKRFPKATHLEFKRGVRGDERIRKLKIDAIIKRNIF